MGTIVSVFAISQAKMKWENAGASKKIPWKFTFKKKVLFKFKALRGVSIDKCWVKWRYFYSDLDMDHLSSAVSGTVGGILD